MQNPLAISTKKVVEDSAVHFAIDLILKNLKRRSPTKPISTPNMDRSTSSLPTVLNWVIGVSFTKLPSDTNSIIVLEKPEPGLTRPDDSLKPLRSPKDMVLSPCVPCYPCWPKTKMVSLDSDRGAGLIFLSSDSQSSG